MFIGYQDQQINEFALGEGGVNKWAQPLLQKASVPDWPFGVRAIRFDVGLVVRFAHFAKKVLKLLVEVGIGHSTGHTTLLRFFGKEAPGLSRCIKNGRF